MPRRTGSPRRRDGYLCCLRAATGRGDSAAGGGCVEGDCGAEELLEALTVEHIEKFSMSRGEMSIDPTILQIPISSFRSVMCTYAYDMHVPHFAPKGA